LQEAGPETRSIEELSLIYAAVYYLTPQLLGLESNDIDIALSDMMGVAFAEHFVPFLEEKGIAVTSIAKVDRNPEQSKHLETGKITILGRELDLVNLRNEEYAEDSRIPTDVVRRRFFLLFKLSYIHHKFKNFGTPLEDARRRDITINSLFYNVHTHSIEDLTKKVKIQMLPCLSSNFHASKRAGTISGMG
jgi:tRNA nucleotidyltransferase (CCA-adding enzyme)